MYICMYVDRWIDKLIDRSYMYISLYNNVSVSLRTFNKDKYCF